MNVQARAAALEKLSDEIRRKTQYELLDRIIAATPFESSQAPAGYCFATQQRTQPEPFQRSGHRHGGAGRAPFQSRGRSQGAGRHRNRRFFIIDAICAKEGITVTDEDIDEEIVKLARANQMRASELYDKLRESDKLRQLEDQVKMRKTAGVPGGAGRGQNCAAQAAAQTTTMNTAMSMIMNTSTNTSMNTTPQASRRQRRTNHSQQAASEIPLPRGERADVSAANAG